MDAIQSHTHAVSGSARNSAHVLHKAYTHWTSHFREQAFPLHVPIHSTNEWNLEGLRPTVVAILFCTNGTVCFVQSAKAGNGGADHPYGLLQGGIKGRETVFDAIYRECKNEIGMQPNCIQEYGYALGACVNTLPPERGVPHKLLLFTAFKVLNPAQLHVNNRKEVIDLRWARSPHDVERLMSSARPHKQLATYAALGVANRKGLIPWSME